MTTLEYQLIGIVESTIIVFSAVQARVVVWLRSKVIYTTVDNLHYSRLRHTAPSTTRNRERPTQTKLYDEYTMRYSTDRRLACEERPSSLSRRDDLQEQEEH